GTEPQYIQVPGVLDPRALARNLERVLARERRLVGRHDLAAPFLEPAQLAKLPQTERPLDIRHVVLEPGSEHLVGPVATCLVASDGVMAEPVQAQNARPRQKRGIRRQHPALARGEVLRGVEAERDGVWAGPD